MGVELELALDKEVLDDEIQSILQHAKPDKCPGNNNIPYRFLQAMGKPLVEAIASLARACFLAEYYPLRFRVARTIVL